MGMEWEGCGQTRAGWMGGDEEGSKGRKGMLAGYGMGGRWGAWYRSSVGIVYLAGQEEQEEDNEEAEARGRG